MTNDKIPACRQAGKAQNKLKIQISKQKIVRFDICAYFEFCALIFGFRATERSDCGST